MQYKTEVTRFLCKGLDVHHQLARLLQKSGFNFKFRAIFLCSRIKDFFLLEDVPCGLFKLFARLQINKQLVSHGLLNTSKVVSSGNTK